MTKIQTKFSWQHKKTPAKNRIHIQKNFRIPRLWLVRQAIMGLLIHNTESPETLTMAILNFPVEFIERAPEAEPSRTLHMVFLGMVTLDDDGELTVYEYSDFQKDASNATKIFSAYLADVRKIKCRVCVSGHGTYRLGRIQLTGTFDRSVPEHITIRLNEQRYDEMVSALQQAWRSSRQPRTLVWWQSIVEVHPVASRHNRKQWHNRQRCKPT